MNMNSLTGPRLAVPDEVPESVVGSVIEGWAARVSDEMDRDWHDLIDTSPWLFMESMQYLMDAVLVQLGVDKPAAVSFSFMNSIIYECECEVLVVWQSPDAKGYFAPFEIKDDCTAMRMSEVLWPSMADFLTNESVRTRVIKKWVWTMSTAADDMPRGATVCG